jgi:hypothetical protein
MNQTADCCKIAITLIVRRERNLLGLIPDYRLARSAKELGAVDAGDAGDGDNHHAGKQLHGGNVAIVEGSRCGREHFEDSQGAPVVAQGRDENGTYAEAAAAGEVDAGIAFGIVAKHDFAGADGFGGDAGVNLQAGR